MSSQVSRFARQTLPEHVFDHPIAFTQAVAGPRRGERVLELTWERAAQLVAPAEQRPPVGLGARLVRADPYVVVYVELPFPRDAGDPCAIVVLGRGDGELMLEDVGYYIVEPRVDEATRATRFVLVKWGIAGAEAVIGDAPAIPDEIVSSCVERVAGIRPSRRAMVGEEVALWYWWHAFRGAEMIALFHATPEHEAWSAVHANPILLLPELVDAAQLAMGASSVLAGLRQMQLALRGSEHFAAFELLLARALADEPGGSPRVNRQRALAVIEEIRVFGGASAEIDALAATLREQVADAPAAAVDPTWSTLFLDDTELGGYQRGVDHRDSAPEDRVFASHGGLRTGYREWIGSDTAPVHQVVDTRWMFPSAKAATAFVQATLTRAAEKLPSVPAPALGDTAHAWGGPGPAGVRVQILLVRIGRVVARIAATEGPKAARLFQPLGPQHLVPYGEAIVKRARWSLARYWLGVARASEAIGAFAHAAPRAQLPLFATYPILALPELPSAMQAPVAEALIAAQAKLKASWQQYRDVMRALVQALLDDTHGEPRVNADAALALVVEHRRHDSDYSWAKIENECRARL